MIWLKKLGNWIWVVLSFIGAIALYVLLSKDETQEKVSKIENEIDDIEYDIIKKEEERNLYLKDADKHADKIIEIEKKIQTAKKKKRNLDDRRKQLKNIFDKYNK